MTTTTAAPGPPSFAFRIGAVDAARLGPSWRPGCPVGPDGLRLLTVRHWGFDDRVHEGELIVATELADAVATIFGRLFDDGFPIRRMRTIEAYGGDDDASMADDNTSAFNCRPVAGSSRWSDHAYGTAVDVNPVENPFVHDGRVDPPAGADHVDRRRSVPGTAQEGGPLVRAFEAAGWAWGGRWSSPDFQHFSVSGR